MVRVERVIGFERTGPVQLRSGLHRIVDAADPDVVDVRWATTDIADDLLDALGADIDAGTTARIATMLRPEDRRRSRLAHGLLRHLVGPAIGIEPADVRLTQRCVVCGSTGHGKPEIADLASGAGPPPTISLSHSGDLVLVALGPARRPVGVDSETFDPAQSWGRVRRHVFSDTEWDLTGRARKPGRDRLRSWVRKEATCKATGHGLAGGLERVQVDEPRPHHLWAQARGPWSGEGVLVADIDVGAEHAAAVAIVSGVSSSPPVIRSGPALGR